jgi:hypothetical protein
MYFREFLKQNFCEENLHFWVDYRNMLYHHQHHQRTNNNSSSSTTTSSDKESTTNGNNTSSSSSSSTTTDYNRILSECYAMYVTYLAPQATMELNIDHTLHQDIIRFVAESFKVVNSNSSTSTSTGTSNLTSSASTSQITDKRPQQSLPFFYTPTHPSQEQQTIIMVTGHRSQCLKTILTMYERVHDQICRIMAEDSLPRFLKSPRYVQWQQRQREKQQELEQQQQMDQASSSSLSSENLTTSTSSDALSPSPMDSSNNNTKEYDETTTTKHDKKKGAGKQSNNNGTRGKEALHNDDEENTDALHKELDRLTLTGVATTATTTTTPVTRPQPKA